MALHCCIFIINTIYMDNVSKYFIGNTHLELLYYHNDQYDPFSFLGGERVNSISIRPSLRFRINFTLGRSGKFSKQAAL